MRLLWFSLLFALPALAAPVTFQWDAAPGYPPGVTYELHANGSVFTGITGTSITVDLPGPGQPLAAQVRAISPNPAQWSDSPDALLPQPAYVPGATVPSGVANLVVGKTTGGPPVMADATFVGASGGMAGSGSTRTITARATTTGNFNFVWTSHYTASVNVSTVNDAAGNTYTRAGTVQGGDANHDHEIWYTANPITGHATNTITITYSGTPAFLQGGQCEFSWSGMSGIAYDAESTHVVSGPTTQVSNTVTTTAVDDLIIGGFLAWTGSSELSPSTGTIAYESGAAAVDDGALAYRFTDAAGGYTIALTAGTTNNYSVIAKAFKGTAGGVTVRGAPDWVGVRLQAVKGALR